MWWKRRAGLKRQLRLDNPIQSKIQYAWFFPSETDLDSKMENWGLKHPREKIVYSFFTWPFTFWNWDGLGMIGGALELLGACTWHQYGPILLRMKTWKNPSTFCHSNMVQTSSNSGAPRSQFRFQVFLGGKIGLQDSGLRGFAWALGCGRTIKNFILKDFCLCWDRIQVFMSECWKFHFKTILIWEHMHFFWWCSALRVSFSDFNFLKVLISQSFHFRFQILWKFPCLRVGISISEVAFLKVFISESCFFSISEVAILRVTISESFHFKFYTFWLRLSISDGLHFCEFRFRFQAFNKFPLLRVNRFILDFWKIFHFWEFPFLRWPFWGLIISFQISNFLGLHAWESAFPYFWESQHVHVWVAWFVLKSKLRDAWNTVDVLVQSKIWLKFDWNN